MLLITFMDPSKVKGHKQGLVVEGYQRTGLAKDVTLQVRAPSRSNFIGQRWAKSRTKVAILKNDIKMSVNDIIFF